LVSEIRDKWIWPFELLEKIGEGGMGVVYRARYVNNDKEVALKLLADTVTDPIILGRFDRELEILRKLRHPNIVYCFGGATEGKYRYYAMEIVDGGSLDGLISRRGSLPWELVVKYARQMCSALDCAHSHGVTHRDVKPGNFLIASNGQLKLSDFGLATFVSAQNLTASGKTMGTFRYMSPEQIRGKDVGPQSDLYSLGCVMFEMLTGQPVFDGKSPAEILDLHLNHPPARASSIALDCPALLDKLISRLLEKDPAKRPESASEVAELLGEVSPIEVVKTRSIPTGRTSTEFKLTMPKVEFSLWRMPAWLVIFIMLAPFFLVAGWTMYLSERSLAGSAMGELVAAWNAQHPEVRTFAAQALGRQAIHDPQALQLLEDALGHADPDIRLNALRGLAEAGSVADRLRPKLKRMQQQDPDQQVRTQINETLKGLDNPRSPHSAKGALWLMAVLSALGLGGYYYARKKHFEKN
jgi:eukaryotic-like serine/threonine-protein kinase